jgi:hypothetical protein
MGVRTTWIFGGVVVLAVACDADGVHLGGEAPALRAAHDNSMYLNGSYLNSMYLNGSYLNSLYLNSLDLNGDYVRATEFAVDQDVTPDVWLEGSQLFIEKKNGAVVSGAGVDKVKIKYEVSKGGKTRKKTLRFNHAQPLAPGSDVWIYDIDLKDGGGGWTSLCVDGEGDATEAILLNDLWNAGTGDRLDHEPTALTYACRGSALAKCVEWGYRPWAQAEGASLREFHQACTRMVRADYCGDGVAHTVNGTPIHVLDEIGVQDVDPSVSYVVEAEWGVDGATCLNSANTRLAGQTIACSLPACGPSFASGGLLQSGKVVGGP